jgi:hypothetical protein
MSVQRGPRPVKPPPEPPEPERDPYAGPYEPDNGTCHNGHPVNWCGRCEPMNQDPPACPA